MNTSSPPRLRVLLARDVPVGLVIRRGPVREFSTFLWDRIHDTFQLGQWNKGRIYVTSPRKFTEGMLLHPIRSPGVKRIRVGQSLSNLGFTLKLS